MQIPVYQIVDEITKLYDATYPKYPLTDSEWVKATSEIRKKLDDNTYTITNRLLANVFNTYMSKNEQLFADILSAQSQTGVTLTDRILGFFKAESASRHAGIFDKLNNFLSGGFKTWLTSLFTSSDSSYEKVFDWLVSQKYISQESRDWLVSQAQTNPVNGAISNILLMLSIVLAQIQIASTLMSGDYIKEMSAKFTPNQLSPNELLLALSRAPEKAEEINKKLQQNGLDNSDINLLKISAYELYDVMQIRECFLRGIISKEKMIERMREHKYTDERIAEITATWDVLPPIQDILTMVAKEAFEPDQVRLYGLDDEFPSEQSLYLNKLGLSEYWQHQYWRAHWQYPGESRALDLLHRGLITEAEMSEFYRVIEIPKYWRDKLIKASYLPYTRVDIRRMHDMGLVTDQEVYDNFRAEGYDDKHAKNMTAFVLKYNEDNNKDITRSQIDKAYKSDMVTKEQALELYQKLGYSKDQSEWFVQVVEYDEAIELQQINIKSVEKAYKKGLMIDSEARSRLSRLNVEPKWIDAYLNKWSIESHIDETLPTKTDVLSWYSKKLINDAEFLSYMRALGYGDKTIEIYLKANATT